MSYRHIYYVMLLAAGSSLLITACGEKPADEVSGVGVGISSSSSTDDPSISPIEVKPTMENLMGKPQEFPKQYAVPKYPNGQVSFVRIERKLYPGWKNQVMLKSGDPPHYIASYYRALLPKDGWVKVYDYENPTYASVVYQRNGQEIEVRVSPDPDGNENIQLLCGPTSVKTKVTSRTPPH